MKYILLIAFLSVSMSCFAKTHIFEDCNNLQKIEVDVYADSRQNLFIKSHGHLYAVNGTDHYQFCSCFKRPHHYESLFEELIDQ